MTDETEKVVEPPSRRRWYQYSLRSLLIVMFLFCILFAWGGYKVQQAEKQKGAVTWARERGGHVNYDYEYDAEGEWIEDAQPPGPDWLRDRIGIDYFSDATVVYLRYGKITDISPLEDMTNLEALSLFNRTAVDLSPLEGLPNLYNIRLSGLQFTDLSSLEGLTNLERLYLERTKVQDLSPLKSLTNLKLLDLERHKISDLSPLAGLTNLEVLNLSYTQVSDLSPLKGLTNMKKLRLVGSQASDQEVQKLQLALPNCEIDRLEDFSSSFPPWP